MTKVRISKPAKSVMQSGPGNNKWIIEFLEEAGKRFTENIMGWTSSKDMAAEIKLEFSNLDSAIEFAKNKNWEYEIINPSIRKIIKKNYADNFK